MRLPNLGVALVAASIGFWGAGCGGNSGEIKAAGFTLDIGDQAYFSYANAQECAAGGVGELVLDLVDFNYLCDPQHPSGRNPGSSHTELKIIVTVGLPPMYSGSYPTLAPYMVGTADCKNGPTSPAIGELLHYPANSTVPDMIKQADSGSVNFTQFDPDKKKQLKGHYELHFDSDVIRSDFALDSCN